MFGRLQHPEVNSRRPGRFEVRLGSEQKRRVIRFFFFFFIKHFPLSLVQVRWPLRACFFLSLPASCVFVRVLFFFSSSSSSLRSLLSSHTRSSPVSLRHRFSVVSHAKVVTQKRAFCSAGGGRGAGSSLRRVVRIKKKKKKSFSLRAAVSRRRFRIYGLGGCRAFSEGMMIVVGSVRRFFFSFPFFFFLSFPPSPPRAGLFKPANQSKQSL